MHRASRMIVNWSRNNGKRKLPNSWHLTKAKLCLKSGSYCHMLGKAWHTTVVLQFLASFLPSTNVHPLIKSAVWAADSVIGLFIDREPSRGYLSEPGRNFSSATRRTLSLGFIFAASQEIHRLLRIQAF